MLRFTPDGTSIQGVPARMLLRFAFGVEFDRMIGVPAWTTSNRFDIEAKVAPEDAPKLEKLTADQRRSMLLPLLAERFNLKYHHETRELPMYALVVAKGGPKLAESKELEPGPSESGAAGTQKGPLNLRGRTSMMPGRIESHGSTMDMLAHSLYSPLGRTIVDKTGLTGNYDYTLQWTVDDGSLPPGGLSGAAGVGGLGGAPTRDTSTEDAGSPSLFTAIEEQLGLKIESSKGPVDVIVIDHLDLPSAN